MGPSRKAPAALRDRAAPKCLAPPIPARAGCVERPASRRPPTDQHVRIHRVATDRAARRGGSTSASPPQPRTRRVHEFREPPAMHESPSWTPTSDEHTQAGFLIERYPPGTTLDQVRAGAEPLASAIELIRRSQVAITYAGAVWVPDDDDDTSSTRSSPTRPQPCTTPSAEPARPSIASTTPTSSHRPPQVDPTRPRRRRRQPRPRSRPSDPTGRDDEVPDVHRRRRPVPQPTDFAKGSAP
jgi:hypothetical protein